MPRIERRLSAKATFALSSAKCRMGRIDRIAQARKVRAKHKELVERLRDPFRRDAAAIVKISNTIIPIDDRLQRCRNPIDADLLYLVEHRQAGEI